MDSSATSSTSETTESEGIGTVKRISFAENAKEKSGGTEVLLLSESHQSTFTAYQKNIDYLTAAKKLKLPQSYWQHLSLMVLVLT